MAFGSRSWITRRSSASVRAWSGTEQRTSEATPASKEASLACSTGDAFDHFDADRCLSASTAASRRVASGLTAITSSTDWG